MIVRTSIVATLDRLEALYLSSATTYRATLYAKLGIIESCGWIEASMDQIVNAYANRKLLSQPFKQVFKSIVQNNHGFGYKNNFRKMLLPTIGIKNVELIHSALNRFGGQIDILDAELQILEIDRNDASHTYVDATKAYPAPSLTKSRVLKIYPILKEIDKRVKRL